MTRPGCYDVLIVGGGHNALVAAAYLSRAGLSTLVIERRKQFGGAATGGRPFPGVDITLSRYSYLVSLLPQRLIADLGLRIRLASRPVASYTPVRRDGKDLGLLVERPEGEATRASFRALTGSEQAYDAWQRFYRDVARFAAVVAPTLLAPLPGDGELRRRVGAQLWDELVETPLGAVLEHRCADDVVRGLVATDGLIGTFTSLGDNSRLANRCLAYHLIGNGTGEWRVPVGGMGVVAAELVRVARESGAALIGGAEVSQVSTDGRTAEVRYLGGDGERVVSGRYLLSGVAPATLAALGIGKVAGSPEGCQLKINLVLSRLPRLASGDDPRQAFAGTFHIDESASQLETAYAEAASGALPSMIPAEVYCHTLTDPSILGPEPAARGWQTMTAFALHTPARLFTGDRHAVRGRATTRVLAGLQRYLAEPLDDCLARDADGAPCVEAKDPYDLEAELAMPGGHIFHGDLQWPWLADGENPADDRGRPVWGVETGEPNVFVCGSGARRGGAVSGIGGHNAAMAVLQREI